MSQAIKLNSGGEMSTAYLEHARQSFLNPADETAFIEFCGKPLRKSIRINRLKANPAIAEAMAARYGWQLTAIPWCAEGFWIDLSDATHEVSLGNLPEHLQGVFYVQEASSMLPPVALLQGESVSHPLVVDVAAAPGSKTTQLAAMLGNRGVVLANELSASRLKGLHSNLVRCGVLNTCLSHQDGRKLGELMPGQFDYVLLDAPCGGEGTVRKDVDALKHWDLERVKALGQLQRELIDSAYRALKPGGRLVYSTCTLSPEENQAVVNYQVQQSDAQIVPLTHLFEGAACAATKEGYLLVQPQLFDSEGFFIACLSKPVESSIGETPRAVYSPPFKALAKTLEQQVVQHFRQAFGVDIEPEGYELKQRDKEVWLFPTQLQHIDRYLKVNRSGMKIANLFPNKVRVTHEFACCFGDRVSRQVVALDRVQASAYYRGENIEVSAGHLKDGEVILTYQGNALSVGLNQRGRIKNGLPRELVRDNLQLP